MPQWKSLEEKREKAVACKERRKQKKLEERVRNRAVNRPLEEATTFVERMTEAANRGEVLDRRKLDEIWAEINRESEKLAEEDKKFLSDREQKEKNVRPSCLKVLGNTPTNENAQDVRFDSKVAKKGKKKVHFEDRNEGFCSKVYDDSKENEKVGSRLVCRAVRSHVSVDTQTEEQVHDTELPLCCTGILFPRVGSQRQIVVKRDHEAMYSMASWDALNLLDFQVPDVENRMQVGDGKMVKVPLVDIQIECEFVSGTIRCGYSYMIPTIPGIDLIIGNDIVTVEEPLEGSVRTAEVEGSVENGIGAVNVRSIVVGTGVEIKETDEMKTNADKVEMFSLSTEEECLSELDLGDLNGMFEESNESVHVINDSVSNDSVLYDESYQMYDDECDMVVNEGVLARLCDCEGCSERFEESIERTHVSNDSVSCLDLTDKQSEEISLRYDNECNKVVNEII